MYICSSSCRTYNLYAKPDKFDENGNILQDEEGNTILDNDNYEWNEETTSWVMVPRQEV